MALADLLARLERRTDTSDTPRNPDGVSVESAPILACTRDTPESSNSESNTSEPQIFPDDRRTCEQCANLVGQRCLSAWRGEIVASRDYEPVQDILRRCEGYMLSLKDAAGHQQGYSKDLEWDPGERIQ